MWFTETPWPPVVIFVAVAIACGWMWQERRQSWWLVGLIACIVLSAGAVIFERAVITPGEQIEQNIQGLAQAFAERDQDEVLSYISQRADWLRNQVMLGFELVDRVENLRITDTDVTMLAENSRAKLHFRANGTIHARDFGDIGHRPTRWLMTWQQEGGLWKVIDLQRLNPITGEPMGMLAADGG